MCICICDSCCCILNGILAIFLPPLTVLIDRGCTSDLLLNIILTLLGWLPGVVHAWFLLCETREHMRQHQLHQCPPT